MDNLAIESSDEVAEISEQAPTDTVEVNPFYDEVSEPSDDTTSEEVTVDSEPEELEDTNQETTLHEVKPNGKVEKVSLEELKAGYMKDRDYRDKTTEVSRTKQMLEAEFKEKTSALDSRIEKLEAFLGTEPEIDLEELKREDPTEYLLVKEQREEAAKALLEEKTKRDKELAAQRQEYQNSEFDKLDEIMGDRWQGDSKDETIKKDIGLAKSVLKEFGISEQETKNLVDHRIWNMVIRLSDAQEQLKVMNEKKQAISKQVEKAPTTVKSGAKPTKAKGDSDYFYNS